MESEYPRGEKHWLGWKEKGGWEEMAGVQLLLPSGMQLTDAGKLVCWPVGRATACVARAMAKGTDIKTGEKERRTIKEDACKLALAITQRAVCQWLQAWARAAPNRCAKRVLPPPTQLRSAQAVRPHRDATAPSSSCWQLDAPKNK